MTSESIEMKSELLSRAFFEKWQIVIHVNKTRVLECFGI